MASTPDPTAPRPFTPEQEARRQEALLAYQRFFARAAALSLSATVAGVIIGIVALQGAAQAVIFAVVGGGGILLAWMILVIRKRIGTGPKGTSPRWLGAVALRRPRRGTSVN